MAIVFLGKLFMRKTERPKDRKTITDEGAVLSVQANGSRQIPKRIISEPTPLILALLEH